MLYLGWIMWPMKTFCLIGQQNDNQYNMTYLTSFYLLVLKEVKLKQL